MAERTIKFRAWDKRTKVMWKPQYLALGLSTAVPAIANSEDEDFENVTIDDQPENILMQYTGLKDKNGKEIYIGSIYKWYQPLVKDREQIHKEHYTAVVDDIVELYYLHNRAENCCGGVEVVGNTHENKDFALD